jgi:hypothetical protein
MTQQRHQIGNQQKRQSVRSYDCGPGSRPLVAVTATGGDLQATALMRVDCMSDMAATEMTVTSTARPYSSREADGVHAVTTVDTVVGQLDGTQSYVLALSSSVLMARQSELIEVFSA